jgi:hypothetical protein
VAERMMRVGSWRADSTRRGAVAGQGLKDLVEMGDGLRQRTALVSRWDVRIPWTSRTYAPSATHCSSGALRRTMAMMGNRLRGPVARGIR